MKKPLSYNETLSIVENFMVKSGIRRYCAEMCYGQCCAGCYESEKACHKNEGRRLACSTYFCGSSCFQKDLMGPFVEAGHHILDCIRDTYKRIGKGSKLSDTSNFICTPNAYFTAPPEEFFPAFEANRKLIKSKITQELITEVKKHMDLILRASEVIMVKNDNKNKKGIPYGRRISRFRIDFNSNGKPYVKDSITGRVFNNEN